MRSRHPTRIGRYEVIDRLGVGGMGSVYSAADPLLGRTVAVKILHSDDDELRERFEREARSAASLRHQHIVTIYDIGEAEGRPFLAMEFIDGESLAEMIRRRAPLALDLRLRLVEQLCAGLGYAHRQGIIHRDIKPANLMVTGEGVLKIVDFGLARVAAAASSMTRAGMLMGTPHYMSPEQVEGTAVNHLSDVFSVGLVLYEILSFRKAYQGDSTPAVLHNILHGTPEPIRALVSAIDPELETIVTNAVQKPLERRYQDLRLLAADLDRVRQRIATASDDATVIAVRPAVEGGTETASRDSDPGRRPASTTAARPGSEGRGRSLDVIAQKRVAQIARHVAAASEHLDAGRFEEAVEQCEHALLLNPHEPRPLQLLEQAHKAIDDRQVERWVAEAKTEVSKGALTRAEALIEQILRRRTDSPEAAALRRQIRDERRERERGAERARAVQAAIGRAQRALQEGALEAAVRAATEALGYDKENSEALALREQASAELEEQRRRQELDQAASTTAARARAQADLGNYDRALALLRRFAPQHPTIDEAIAEIEARVAALEAKRRDEEERARQRALEEARRREEIAAAQTEATEALQRADVQAARAILRRFRESWPGHPEAERLCRHIESMVEAAEAAERLRASVKRHLHAAEAAIAQGEFTAATNSIEAAIALAPDDQEALRLHQQVRVLVETRRRQEQQRREAEATIAHAWKLALSNKIDDGIRLLQAFAPAALVASELLELREQRERQEQERLAREKADRAERERQARERAAHEEQERLAREQAERDERERLERERLTREEAEREEQERLAREQAERDERERLERERLARENAERGEQERLVHEQAERDERERLERERLARENAERGEQERLVHEQAERDERERLEPERLARKNAERQEQERLVHEQAERAERERLEQERLAREKAEREEQERLVREEAEREEQERLVREEAERAERERLERERLAREKAEREGQERLAREEAERAERERLERERLAREQAERDERERLERERLAREKAEREQRERLERERMAQERAEREKAEREQERLRIAQGRAERARLEQERREQERKAREERKRAARAERKERELAQRAEREARARAQEEARLLEEARAREEARQREEARAREEARQREEGRAALERDRSAAEENQAATLLSEPAEDLLQPRQDLLEPRQDLHLHSLELDRVDPAIGVNLGETVVPFEVAPTGEAADALQRRRLIVAAVAALALVTALTGGCWWLSREASPASRDTSSRETAPPPRVDDRPVIAQARAEYQRGDLSGAIATALSVAVESEARQEALALLQTIRQEAAARAQAERQKAESAGKANEAPFKEAAAKAQQATESTDPALTARVVTLYDEAGALYRTAASAGWSAPEYLESARREHAASRIVQAIEYAIQALTADPRSREALSFLQTIRHDAAGQAEAARRSAGQRGASPERSAAFKEAAALEAQGRSLTDARDTRRAYEAFVAARTRYGEAVKEAAAQEFRNEQAFGAHLDRFEAALSVGEFTTAAEWLARAEQINPTNARVADGRKRLDAARRRPATGSDTREAERREVEQLLTAASKAANEGEAIRLLTGGLERFPNQPDLSAALAKRQQVRIAALVKQAAGADHGQAVQLLEDALAVDPGRSDVRAELERRRGELNVARWIREIQQTIARYEAAYETKNASDLLAVTTYRTRADIEKEFKNFDRFQLTVESCAIEVAPGGATATATCLIHRASVPAGISSRPLEDHFNWRFRLTNTNGVWQIGAAARQ